MLPNPFLEIVPLQNPLPNVQPPVATPLDLWAEETNPMAWMDKLMAPAYENHTQVSTSQTTITVDDEWGCAQSQQLASQAQLSFPSNPQVQSPIMAQASQLAVPTDGEEEAAQRPAAELTTVSGTHNSPIAISVDSRSPSVPAVPTESPTYTEGQRDTLMAVIGKIKIRKSAFNKLLSPNKMPESDIINASFHLMAKRNGEQICTWFYSYLRDIPNRSTRMSQIAVAFSPPSARPVIVPIFVPPRDVYKQGDVGHWVLLCLTIGDTKQGLAVTRSMLVDSLPQFGCSPKHYEPLIKDICYVLKEKQGLASDWNKRQWKQHVPPSPEELPDPIQTELMKCETQPPGDVSCGPRTIWHAHVYTSMWPETPTFNQSVPKDLRNRIFHMLHNQKASLIGYPAPEPINLNAYPPEHETVGKKPGEPPATTDPPVQPTLMPDPRGQPNRAIAVLPPLPEMPSVTTPQQEYPEIPDSMMIDYTKIDLNSTARRRLMRVDKHYDEALTRAIRCVLQEPFPAGIHEDCVPPILHVFKESLLNYLPVGIPTTIGTCNHILLQKLPAAFERARNMSERVPSILGSWTQRNVRMDILDLLQGYIKAGQKLPPLIDPRELNFNYIPCPLSIAFRVALGCALEAPMSLHDTARWTPSMGGMTEKPFSHNTDQSAPAPNPMPSPQTQHTMKSQRTPLDYRCILSWNCGSINTSIDELTYYIHSCEVPPSVILLQEIFAPDKINGKPIWSAFENMGFHATLNCMLGYKLVSLRLREDSSRGGVAILARNDVIVEEIKITVPWGEATGVSLQVNNTVKLRIASWYAPPDNRKESLKPFVISLKILMEHFDIVCGDLNAHDTSWSIQTNKRGPLVVKLLERFAWARVKLDLATHRKHGATEDDGTPDLILSSYPIPAMVCQPLQPFKNKDHFPILAQITNCPPKKLPPRWPDIRWSKPGEEKELNSVENSMNRQLFLEPQMQLCMLGIREGDPREIAEGWIFGYFANFTKTIKKLPKVGRHSVKNEVQFGEVTPTGNQAVDEANRQKAVNSRIWEKIKAVNTRRMNVHNLVKSMIGIWQRTPSIQKTKQEIADQFADICYVKKHSRNVKIALKDIRHLLPFDLKPIHADEVKQAIELLNPKQSTDSGGTPLAVFAKLDDSNIELLANVITECLRWNIQPNELSQREGVPIPKPGLPTHLFENYRPVTVVNTVAKIIDVILQRRKYGQTNRQSYHQSQDGFTPGHRASDALYHIISEICNASQTYKAIATPTAAAPAPVTAKAPAVAPAPVAAKAPTAAPATVAAQVPATEPTPREAINPNPRPWSTAAQRLLRLRGIATPASDERRDQHLTEVHYHYNSPGPNTIPFYMMAEALGPERAKEMMDVRVKTPISRIEFERLVHKQEELAKEAGLPVGVGCPAHLYDKLPEKLRLGMYLLRPLSNQKANEREAFDGDEYLDYLQSTYPQPINLDAPAPEPPPEPADPLVELYADAMKPEQPAKPKEGGLKPPPPPTVIPLGEEGSNRAKNKEHVMYVAVDFVDAFCRVPPEIVLDTDAPDYIKYWHYLSLKSQKVMIRFGGKKSKWHILDGGVTQGTSSASDIFNIFMDGLLRRLSEAAKKPPKPKTVDEALKASQGCTKFNVAFADDLTLILRGESRDGLISCANEMLQIIDEWSKQYEIRVSIKKTKAMLVRPHGADPSTLKEFSSPMFLRCGADEIKVMKETGDTLRILGFLLDPQGNFKAEVERRIAQCRDAMLDLSPLRGKLAPHFMYELAMSRILPHLTQDIFLIWSMIDDQLKERLEQQLVRVARFVISAPETANGDYCMFEAGFRSLAFTAAKQAKEFTAHRELYFHAPAHPGPDPDVPITERHIRTMVNPGQSRLESQGLHPYQQFASNEELAEAYGKTKFHLDLKGRSRWDTKEDKLGFNIDQCKNLPRGFRIATDASVTPPGTAKGGPEGKSGGGFFLSMENNPKSYYAGPHYGASLHYWAPAPIRKEDRRYVRGRPFATSFSMERMTILEALEHVADRLDPSRDPNILEWRREEAKEDGYELNTIAVLSDSLSSLSQLATGPHKIRNREALQIWEQIVRLRRMGFEVIFVFVFSHCKYIPNDYADAIAAEAAKTVPMHDTGLRYDSLITETTELRREDNKKIKPKQNWRLPFIQEALSKECERQSNCNCDKRRDFVVPKEERKFYLDFIAAPRLLKASGSDQIRLARVKIGICKKLGMTHSDAPDAECPRCHQHVMNRKNGKGVIHLFECKEAQELREKYFIDCKTYSPMLLWWKPTESAQYIRDFIASGAEDDEIEEEQELEPQDPESQAPAAPAPNDVPQTDRNPKRPREPTPPPPPTANDYQRRNRGTQSRGRGRGGFHDPAKVPAAPPAAKSADIRSFFSLRTSAASQVQLPASTGPLLPPSAAPPNVAVDGEEDLNDQEFDQFDTNTHQYRGRGAHNNQVNNNRSRGRGGFHDPAKAPAAPPAVKTADIRSFFRPRTSAASQVPLPASAGPLFSPSAAPQSVEVDGDEDFNDQECDRFGTNTHQNRGRGAHNNQVHNNRDRGRGGFHDNNNPHRGKSDFQRGRGFRGRK